MKRTINLTALMVDDYDEAIGFYVRKLGFELIADHDLPEADATGRTKRWVVVRPPGATEGGLLLARPDDDAQRARIGNQTGGRVFLFLTTDDFARDHAAFVAAGVEFTESPRHEPYGTVAVFRDLYGNLWDLIEPTAADGDQ